MVVRQVMAGYTGKFSGLWPIQDYVTPAAMGYGS